MDNMLIYGSLFTLFGMVYKFFYKNWVWVVVLFFAMVVFPTIWIISDFNVIIVVCKFVLSFSSICKM